MNAASKRGKFEDALAWFRRMRDLDREPNHVVYSTLINAAVNSGLPNTQEVVANLYNEMLAAKIKPDTYVFGALIQAAAVYFDAERAETWFERMQQEGIQPNDVRGRHCASHGPIWPCVAGGHLWCDEQRLCQVGQRLASPPLVLRK